VIQVEPWLERDRAMIQMLESVGILKGQAFVPDDDTERALDGAAQPAHAYLDERYETFFERPYFPNSRWAVPAPMAVIEGQQSGYANPNSYPVDDRGTLFTFAFFSAKHVGAGQFYLMTIKDADGNPFNGAQSYRLTVPAKAPVTLYWSATIYDRQTHTLIANTFRSSRASNAEGLQANSDGSVDIHIGPHPPEGGESNWIPTD
jgi:hypothetical protein